MPSEMNSRVGVEIGGFEDNLQNIAFFIFVQVVVV